MSNRIKDRYMVVNNLLYSLIGYLGPMYVFIRVRF